MLKLMKARGGSNRFGIRAIQVIYNMKFSREMVKDIFELCSAVDSMLMVEE
jgi:uncharacterized UPF0146 family protein